LNHFGASHSAALSSLAPASALVLATVAASTIAAAFRSANLWDVPITADTGCVRYLKIPVRRMNR
jgi:hypothetical protein